MRDIFNLEIRECAKAIRAEKSKGENASDYARFLI